MNNNIYPLSDSQKTIIIGQLFSLHPSDVRENNTLSFYFLVPKKCNYDALEKAFNLVIERNDAFRIRIFRKGFKFVQHIKEYKEYKLNRVKLNNRAWFEEYLKHIDKNIIKLTSENLIWAELADMGDCGAIVIRMHHICTDGFSVNLFFKQLESFYEKFAKGETPEEPKRLYSVANFWKQEQEYKKSEQHKKDIEFWKKVYNTQRHYSFPAGRRCEDGVCERESLEIGGAVYAKLVKLCKSEGFSLQYLIMSLTALTVSALTGEDNFCLYSLTHGRTTFPLKQTAGYMMNTVPVFYDIDFNLPVREFLSKQYMNFLDFLAHGKLSSGEQTPLSYKECIKNKFNFLHGWLMFSSMDYADTFAHSKYEMQRLPSKTLPYQFYLAFLDIKGVSAKINLDYQAKRFSKEQITKALNTLYTICERVGVHSDAPINSIIKGV